MSGLGPEAAAFLAALAANNSRDWFHAEKAAYERDLKGPAEAFSAVLADRLAAAHGMAHTPRIFRIARDVRFSKDKTPYNAHLHISFVPQADGAPPAWLFGLEPKSLVLGTGIFAFEGAALDKWREAVAGPDGEELAGIVAELEGQGVRFSEPELKRVPAPYDKDHPRGDLLRRKGLAAWLDGLPMETAYGENGPANCVREFARLEPVFAWLMRLNAR